MICALTLVSQFFAFCVPFKCLHNFCLYLNVRSLKSNKIARAYSCHQLSPKRFIFMCSIELRSGVYVCYSEVEDVTALHGCCSAFAFDFRGMLLAVASKGFSARCVFRLRYKNATKCMMALNTRSEALCIAVTAVLSRLT